MKQTDRQTDRERERERERKADRLTYNQTVTSTRCPVSELHKPEQQMDVTKAKRITNIFIIEKTFTH